MMNLLDEKSPIALYYQLKEIFLKKIISKEWNIQDKIPNEFELCEQYHVSRITVRQALAELEKEGYVVRKQGKGTYVSVPKIEQNLTGFYSFSEEFKKMGFTPSSKVLKFYIQNANQDVAAKLQLNSSNDKVYFIKRLRYADEMVMAIESTYLPASLLPGLTMEDLESKSLYTVIRDNYSIVPSDAEESFGATLLSENDAKYFGVKKGTAALDVDRLTFNGQNCIEYTKGVVRGDMFRFRVKLK